MLFFVLGSISNSQMFCITPDDMSTRSRSVRISDPIMPCQLPIKKKIAQGKLFDLGQKNLPLAILFEHG